MTQPNIRQARPDDALSLGVLATQVFLDTYAFKGITQQVAEEVRGAFSTDAFAALLREPARTIFVAEAQGALVGFAQLTLGAMQPLAGHGVHAELDRLYVQRPALRHGIGQALLKAAEQSAAAQAANVIWLTSWVGNTNALAFYAAQGYVDQGEVMFHMQGETIPNRVLVKRQPKQCVSGAGLQGIARSEVKEEPSAEGRRRRT